MQHVIHALNGFALLALALLISIQRDEYNHLLIDDYRGLGFTAIMVAASAVFQFVLAIHWSMNND